MDVELGVYDALKGATPISSIHARQKRHFINIRKELREWLESKPDVLDVLKRDNCTSRLETPPDLIEFYFSWKTKERFGVTYEPTDNFVKHVEFEGQNDRVKGTRKLKERLVGTGQRGTPEQRKRAQQIKPYLIEKLDLKIGHPGDWDRGNKKNLIRLAHYYNIDYHGLVKTGVSPHAYDQYASDTSFPDHGGRFGSRVGSNTPSPQPHRHDDQASVASVGSVGSVASSAGSSVGSYARDDIIGKIKDINRLAQEVQDLMLQPPQSPQSPQSPGGGGGGGSGRDDAVSLGDDERDDVRVPPRIPKSPVIVPTSPRPSGMVDLSVPASPGVGGRASGRGRGGGSRVRDNSVGRVSDAEDSRYGGGYGMHVGGTGSQNVAYGGSYASSQSGLSKRRRQDHIPSSVSMYGDGDNADYGGYAVDPRPSFNMQRPVPGSVQMEVETVIMEVPDLMQNTMEIGAPLTPLAPIPNFYDRDDYDEDGYVIRSSDNQTQYRAVRDYKYMTPTKDQILRKGSRVSSKFEDIGSNTTLAAKDIRVKREEESKYVESAFGGRNKTGRKPDTYQDGQYGTLEENLDSFRRAILEDDVGVVEGILTDIHDGVIPNRLESGKRIHVEDPIDKCDGRNLFIRCCLKNQLQIAERLLEADILPRINVNEKQGDQTALCCAVRYKHKRMVQFLLGNNADVNVKTDLGYTPLMIAIIQEDQEIFDMLVPCKVDWSLQVTTEEAGGFNALHLAVTTANSIMIMKVLTEHRKKQLGPYIDSRSLGLGVTALVVAVIGGNTEIVRLLLNWDVPPDLTLKFNTQKTVLDYAMEKRNVNSQIWDMLCSIQVHEHRRRESEPQSSDRVQQNSPAMDHKHSRDQSDSFERADSHERIHDRDARMHDRDDRMDDREDRMDDQMDDSMDERMDERIDLKGRMGSQRMDERIDLRDRMGSDERRQKTNPASSPRIIISRQGDGADCPHLEQVQEGSEGDKLTKVFMEIGLKKVDVALVVSSLVEESMSMEDLRDTAMDKDFETAQEFGLKKGDVMKLKRYFEANKFA